MDAASLARFATEATGMFRREASSLAKDARHLPFASLLSSHLAGVIRRLERSPALHQGRLSQLLECLERLATWPTHFTKPTSPYSRSAYPHLVRALSEEGSSDLRCCIGTLARDQRGTAIRHREKFLQSFEKFANIKKVPRGPKQQELVSSRVTSGSRQDPTECLQRLFATICHLCHCPLPAGSGGFKANIDPHVMSRTTRGKTGLTADLFILHSHTPDNPGRNEWKEIRVRVFLEFEQPGRNIAEICPYIQSQELGRLKLIASNHGLFDDGIEPGNDISLQTPSISLARIIPSATLKQNEHRKLLLSYRLSKAVWQFYDSEWMTNDWTKHTVQFMRQQVEEGQISVTLHPQPFILAEFQASTPELNCQMNPEGSSNGSTIPTEPQRSRNNSHIFPKILALGIVLLEIQMGEDFEDRYSNEFFDATGQVRGNASHCTAVKFIKSKEWARRTDILQAVRQVIEICVKPDIGKLGVSDTSIRDSLYKNVVAPLGELFAIMYQCPSGSPDQVNPDPMTFETPGEHGSAVSMYDLVGRQKARQARDAAGTLEHPRLVGVSPALPDRTVQQQQAQSRHSHYGTSAPDTGTCELFGDGDEESYDDRHSRDTDKWVFRFKILRMKHGIGRLGKDRIKVAILDTGIDINHPDVKNDRRIKDFESFVDSDAREDTCGHGTHIAGIMLNLTCNVDLYIAKVTESRVSEGNLVRERISRALRYARDVWGVHVISLSLGFNKTTTPDTVRQEIEECLNRKIVVFASASNDGGNSPRTYPGDYDRVLCIHSATAKGKGSNFSPTPQLRSDNFSVIGECIKSGWPLTTTDEQRTKRKSGTSFATPVAVSIAAFMIGFIRTHMQDFQPNVEPLSPLGVRKIFAFMSEGNKRDGYDYISPEWFFTEHGVKTIKARLEDELS